MKLRKITPSVAQVLLRSGSPLHAEYQFDLFVKDPEVTFWTPENALQGAVVASAVVPSCSQKTPDLFHRANDLIRRKLPTFSGVIHTSAEDR